MRVAATTLCISMALSSAAPAATTVIEHVTIVDTAADRPEIARQTDRTIVVEGGIIRYAGPAEGTHVPEDATRIDGRGRYVMPGLWDMHVHLNRFGRMLDGSLDLLVANGVTGVRNMRSDVWPGVSGVSIEDMRALQRKIDAGETIGPRLLSLPCGVHDEVWTTRRCIRSSGSRGPGSKVASSSPSLASVESTSSRSTAVSRAKRFSE
jgi:hypothetical protein